jgi:hypothetical protein
VLLSQRWEYLRDATGLEGLIRQSTPWGWSSPALTYKARLLKICLVHEGRRDKRLSSTFIVRLYQSPEASSMVPGQSAR